MGNRVKPSRVTENMNAVQTRGFASKALNFFRDPSVSLWKRLAGVAAVAYILLPIDAVPDVLPIVGWLDDLGVLSAAAMYLLRQIQKHGGEQ
jgi:uncharacterized membrane protein YkvA (DUF1232 family)